MLARFDLLPAEPLRQVAEHYGKGAEKYAARNWERGYEWSKSYGALQRHANAFWGGEDIDEETGSPHMAAVVFHALALLEFARTHEAFDDRPNSPSKRLRRELAEELREAFDDRPVVVKKAQVGVAGTRPLYNDGYCSHSGAVGCYDPDCDC